MKIIIITLLAVYGSSVWAGVDPIPTQPVPDAGASALLLSIGAASLALLRGKSR